MHTQESLWSAARKNQVYVFLITFIPPSLSFHIFYFLSLFEYNLYEFQSDSEIGITSVYCFPYI